MRRRELELICDRCGAGCGSRSSGRALRARLAPPDGPAGRERAGRGTRPPPDELVRALADAAEYCLTCRRLVCPRCWELSVLRCPDCAPKGGPTRLRGGREAVRRATSAMRGAAAELGALAARIASSARPEDAGDEPRRDELVAAARAVAIGRSAAWAGGVALAVVSPNPGDSAEELQPRFDQARLEFDRQRARTLDALRAQALTARGTPGAAGLILLAVSGLIVIGILGALLISSWMAASSVPGRRAANCTTVARASAHACLPAPSTWSATVRAAVGGAVSVPPPPALR